MFQNRRDAGEQLGEVLLYLKRENPVVLAIPRGGVEIGFCIARKLDCEFSVVICRKLGFPENPEAAFGAIAEDGTVFLLHRDVSRYVVDQVKKKEMKEITRRIQEYRQGESIVSVKGRTVILADDGIATGATLFAAIEFCKHQQAERIIVAAPVSDIFMKRRLRETVDEVVILETPEMYRAVSQVYRDFRNVDDDEVKGFIKMAKNRYRKTKA